jgi:hypothetical protein
VRTLHSVLATANPTLEDLPTLWGGPQVAGEPQLAGLLALTVAGHPVPESALQQTLALAVFVAAYVGLGLGRLPVFRVDRTGVAIIGGALMVLTGMLPWNDAVLAVDAQTLVLLFGMMVVAAYPAAPIPRSLGSRLKKLDRIAGRIVEEDLRATRSGHDVVAELHPGGAETIDLGSEVVDDEVDTVPAPGCGPPAIGHRAPGRAARCAQEQPQVAPADVGKGRRGLGDQREAEVRRVEGDSGLDVVDHVANVHGGHGCSSSPEASGGSALALAATIGLRYRRRTWYATSSWASSRSTSCITPPSTRCTASG